MATTSAPRRPTGRSAPGADVPAATVDAALAVSRVLVAMSVQSMAEVDDQVTVVQLRTLIVVQARGPLNLGGVAELTGTHISNASRTCERLVGLGLLTRHDDPDDRRNVLVDVTAEGRKLVHSVMRRRRRLLTALLGGLEPGQLAALAGPLQALAALAGDSTHLDEWSGAWGPA